MDIITILQALLHWGKIALAGAAAALLAGTGAYLIYKKAFHGKRTVARAQIVLAGLLCCWLLLVICLTSFSRGANFTSAINLNFLSGYISAWNNWSVSELQLILLNMLMFVPLGFLLPLVWKRAENVWVALGASLGVTAFIEVLQFVTGTGIFELDDLFHNLIGSLLGYFCIMAILASIREKRICLRPIARALVIPCAIGLALGGACYAYEHQPYGNMDILPASRQDMSKIRIVTSLKLSGQRGTAAVYKNRFAEDMAYVQKIKTGLADLENLTFDRTERREGENLGYTGTDAHGTAFQMSFFFRSGEWSYTTFEENAAQLTEKTAHQFQSHYEKWMNEEGLLPHDAVCSVQNGDTLRWDVVRNVPTVPGAFQKGSAMMQFDESGALINFYYQISWNEYVATENIISESEAYIQVEQGNFEQYVPFQQGDVMHIEECELTYVYDTKGFYQPAYEFRGYINSSENFWSCRIPALQK